MACELGFEPEFACAADWAEYYRRCGLQAVPAKPPLAGENWKRPAVEWKGLENALADDATFASWFGPDGRFKHAQNIGIITGGEPRMVVIDFDHQKKLGSLEWWIGALAVHNNGMELDVPTVRTGGGGTQMFVRWPLHRQLPSSYKTPIGIDIRAQGGFVVAPPSKHESGRFYQWEDGRTLEDLDIEDAPEWLCDLIDALLLKYTRQHALALGEAQTQDRQTAEIVHLPTPANPKNFSGELLDGREGHMTEVVWGAVTDLYRACPIRPGVAELEEAMRAAYLRYEKGVASRIKDPLQPKHILLEREGRGVTYFREKWAYAVGQWDGKIAEAARHLPAHRAEALLAAAERAMATEVGVTADGTRFDPVTGEVIEEPDFKSFNGEEDWDAPAKPTPPVVFETLNIAAIKTMPDPLWLVEGLIIEQGLGFVYGPPGCFKSFLTLGLGLAIAQGQPDWFGYKINKPGIVLYISSEGTTDMKFRIQAQQIASGCQDDNVPFYLIHQSINFLNSDDIEKLIRTIKVMTDRLGAAPTLVVVDTVSRVLPGAKENNQEDMTIFVQACDIVRQTFGSTVIGVHHSSKHGGQMRGSGVLQGAGDVVLSVAREPEQAPEETQRGTILAEKIKAARDGWTLDFQMREVTWPKSISSSYSSLYAEPAAAEEGESFGPSKRACAQLFVAIARAFARGQPLSMHDTPKINAEGRFLPDWARRQIGMGKDTATKLVGDWLANAVIEVVDDPKPGLKPGRNGLTGTEVDAVWREYDAEDKAIRG